MMISLQEFYEAIRAFLIESGLETEQSMSGYSVTEILSVERFCNIKFPEAYKLFLQYFGLSSRTFEDQDWSIESIKFAAELSREIAKRNELDFGNWFPFSERQWYCFYSFEKACTQVNNPEILLVVEGDDGVEVCNYPSFTTWFLTKLDSHLNLLVSLDRPKAVEQLKQFEVLQIRLQSILP